MLANSSGNKLKASKGFKESDGVKLLVSEDKRTLDRGEGDKDRASTGENTSSKNSYTSSVVYSRDRSFKPRPRNRDDFRISRGSAERRGGSSRGRGIPHRKSEKEGELYVQRGKFQESLSKGKSSDGLPGMSYSKYNTTDIDGGKSKSADYGNYPGLPEDSRISKVLRRMSREDDPDKFIAYCNQLQEAIVTVDNARYIRRATDLICESLLDMLHSGPNSSAKLHAAKCLGRLGHTLEQDFKKFMDWVFSNYSVERNDDVKNLLLNAVLETVRLEQEHPQLKEFVPPLMQHLYLTLESIDKPQLLLVTIEVLLDLTSLYPDAFTKYFKDTVDILVGWHIDLTTPTNVVCYASQSLQRLSPYWANHIDFSLTMLGHFLEDQEVSFEDFLDASTSSGDEQDPTALEQRMKLISFMKVFNTVVKGMGQNLSPNFTPEVSWTFLTDCFARILAILLKGLKTLLDYELFITGNECTWLLLNLLQSKTSPAHEDLYQLIDLEISLMEQLTNTALSSALQLIAKVIKELSANLPLDLVERILKPNSPLLDLRFSPCRNVHNGIVAIYHSLLSLKNIPLLKEAYRLILTDLDTVYRVLVPELEPLCAGIEASDRATYCCEQVESVVIFHLKALTDIANASNSLIGMWVLQPSILDLLAVRLIPFSIGRVSSPLLFTQLYLLYSHCSRHSHFITTSNLVGGCQGRPGVNSLVDTTQTSPTAGHFVIIVSLLASIVNQELNEESMCLVLNWCCELFVQSRTYLTTLATTVEMTRLACALCSAATCLHSDNILLAICTNLENLLVAPYTLCWNKQVLEQIADVCLLHVNSNNAEVAERYSRLMLQLPWTVVIPSLQQGNVKKGSGRMRLESAAHTQMTHDANTGEMSPQRFKQFMAYLLHGHKSELQEVFTCCWSLTESEPQDMNSLREICLSSQQALFHWATWESAQFCVNTKLRTPFGKPLDTFMAFEGAMKSLARETVGSVRAEVGEEFDVRRVRLLLEVVEQLEKCMYNASDGTAAVLVSPSKPVRTFFHTNKSTCNEWLSRNRSAVVGVALHCGMAAMALRHGHALLQDLLDAGNVKGSEFENAVLQVGWALLKVKEPEAVQGLYVWCRDEIGVKYHYLKAFADHAAGKLETAVEMYKKLMKNESVESPNSKRWSLPNENSELLGHNAKILVADQITECYLALQDWTQLAEWKTEEAELLTSQNGGTSIKYKLVTARSAEGLAQYEKGDLTAACELLEWSTEPVEDKRPAWDCYQLLGNTRHRLANIAVRSIAGGAIHDEDRQALHECRAAAHCYLLEGLRNTPSEVVQEAAILEFAANALLSQHEIFIDCSEEMMKAKTKEADSVLLSRILWWGQALEKLAISSQPSPQLSLDAAKQARKEGNLKLALKQLSQHMNQILHQDNGHRTQLVLTDNLLADMDNVSPWSLPKAQAFSELSKLLHSVGNVDLAVSVGSTAALQIAEVEERPVREVCSRLLLSLAQWIPLRDSSEVPDSVQQLIDWQQRRVTDTSNLLDIANFDPEGDVVGTLLQLAVSHYPELAKGWVALAGWAFRRGRKATDQVLTHTDKEHITALIPDSVDKESVFSILTRTTPHLEDEDIEVENISQSETVEWELQKLNVFTAEQLAGLLDMWRKSHARTYNCYQLSAHAYFKYLQLCANPQDDSDAITACLRLLRLIVKHAEELQSVLEVGLSTTPSLPWVCIIPQLFSRLSHPQPYVRRRVSELLCRLATDKPHLIIFPSVVGSDAGAQTIRDMPRTKLFSNNTREVEEDLVIEDEEEEEFEEEEDEIHDGEETQAMENCFQAMVDILSKQDGDGIAQVQVFVRELRRITLLWDELWLGTLQQHHSYMSRRVQCLEQEVTRVDDNPHLSPAEKDRLVAENHRVILKPLLFVLEQLYAITSVTAETPHETWFQEKFGSNITEVLEKLRQPSDPRKPSEAWSALKGLQVKLQQRANKRASYSLRMKDVSPTLAGMRNTQISMPGMKSVLTIAGIHDHIAVLPTKTKPKKLVFQGSNGKLYTYLFKGLEDLHLDERIMQFLSIANTMLRDSTNAPLQACHYAVIPLGLRSGLISWVEGVTPLFSLYKRWQQRQASVNQSTVMRPSELFYSKLTPLLKDCEVTKPESRLEWPLPVLKQVLTELMQETPTYLLSRELWCDSVNAGGWWRSLKLYSTSLAVMSIIGYIIGLGDRHLDNVLVDLTSGQVVHIDYNVCFEKGKSLRVPEKVPFRLTPNLRAALGVTGVEGLFRLTCEHVLKVMKKGRETVLTLLEAFVYDPLIDWTPGSETGYTGAVYGGGRAVALESKQSRKQLEQEVTTAMLAIRLAEMKYDWLDNRDKLLVALPELAAMMDLWLRHKAAVKCAEEVLQERHQLMALVKEAEAHGPEHQLFNLAVRHRGNVTATEASANARAKLQARVDDCVRQQQQYNVALCYFYGAQMSQWVTEVNSRTSQDTYMVFDLIKEFLQNAGQGQMVTQCSQSEKELSELCNQQTQCTRACLDMLGQYGAIVRQFPVSHINQHRSSLYQRWAVVLLEAPYVESCELVLKDMQKELSPPKLSLASNIVGFNMGLQRLVAESRVRLAERSEAAELVTQAATDVDKAVERLRAHNQAAVSAVVLTALTELNKRSLMMESAAKSARECLVDLTSQKGDWFFDDLCLSTSTANQLLTLLPPPEPDSPLHNAVKCVDVVYKQFKTLQELNVNFSSIILPEAIQTIQREDLSVLTLIAELDAIVASLQVPLQELVAQLQLHLHYCLVGIGSPQDASMEKVQALQQAVEAMFHRLSTGDTLTPGQMLFMGFNGLFDNLTLGNASLFSAVASLNPPAAWKSVDQLRDAKLLTTPLYDQTARAVLDSIFLVKRLQAMQELFALCRANAEAFQGISVGLPYDDDRFNRPIRCFTADYVSSQLLGVFSYTLAVTLCFLMQQMGLNVTGEVEQREVGANSRVSLQELGKSTVALCIRQKLIPNSNALRETSGVVMTVETGWRAQLVAGRAAQELKRAEVTLQRLQLQLTAHCWLHEDILAHSQVNMHPPPLGRSTFMVDLRKTSAALMQLQPRLMEGIEQQSALINSAEQRLKWAAGANPALAEVMCAFETAVKNNNDQLILEQSLGNLVANICNTVLWYEALRTRTTEALANDAAFLQLVEEMRQSCLLYQSLNTQMSPLEESLVKLCPPDTQVDWAWISKAVLAISESVKKLLEEMEPLQSQLTAAYEAVKSAAAVLRSLHVIHYRTMSDVRSLLKTMVKFDEPGVADYLTNYRAYTDRVTMLIKTVEALDEFTPDKLQTLLQEIAIIEGETPGVYEDLLRLSSPEGEGAGRAANRRPPLLRQDSVCMSPKRDPHTGKAVQERNAYALSVWRRVRLKLEGKDPDISRKYNVQEQVDWCINEATCLDNLALLYEGWTPWV